MGENKTKKDSLPEEFNSIEEAAEFWDTHSLADYEDFRKDADFGIKLKLSKFFAKSPLSGIELDLQRDKSPPRLQSFPYKCTD